MQSILVIPYYLFCTALFLGACLIFWAIFGWWFLGCAVALMLYGATIGDRHAKRREMFKKFR